MEQIMRHGSLFSGIGGFDLAAERVGWRNVFHVERDAFCRQVLKHHFPNSRSFEKIEEFDGFTPIVDVISGGFPCQPFSNAGQRRGIADDRYLWPEMFRVIRNNRPRWVVAENVSGLVNWSNGLVFETVCADLETEGFEVGAFLIPAAGVGAPHRRERIWIVAHAKHAKSGTLAAASRGTPEEIRREKEWFVSRPHVDRGHVADAHGEFLQRGNKQGTTTGTTNTNESTEPRNCTTKWEKFPSFEPICRGNDGISEGLDGITFPKWRKESIKAFGNAVVPDVAQRIFETIQAVEDGRTTWSP